MRGTESPTAWDRNLPWRGWEEAAAAEGPGPHAFRSGRWGLLALAFFCFGEARILRGPAAMAGEKQETCAGVLAARGAPWGLTQGSEGRTRSPALEHLAPTCPQASVEEKLRCRSPRDAVLLTGASPVGLLDLCTKGGSQEGPLLPGFTAPEHRA